MRPQEAWRATQGQLRVQLHRATYDTWVRDCEFVSFQNGVFTLSVRNAYIKDWLETRLHRSIRHTLSGIFRTPVEIDFVVAHAATSHPYTPEESAAHGFINDPSQPLAPEIIPPTASYFQPKSPEPVADQLWNARLNGAYTFETFVVGSSNQMAYGSARAVSENPAQTYNPLFLYGESGVGKTHLLHAIGHQLAQMGYKVLYTTAEQFTNHLVESIRHKQTINFRDTYRGLDILLIDDVQFLSNKSNIQEEFFHTFNALHGQGKQVVLASDRHPDEIESLGERLRSRFVWGLLVDIRPPDLTTRLAILRDKAEMQGRRLPLDIAQLIAEQVTGTVRDLEGKLTQVLAYSDLMGAGLTFAAAERILNQSREPRDQATMKRRLNLAEVLQATAQYYQLRLADLSGPSRQKDIVNVRQLAIYLAREETGASLPEIGDALGRNHSTILYSYNKVAEQMARDSDLRRKVEDVRHYLYAS